jgi:amidase/aspartyl-tRNA(Asn)/glutamyl-tRNA(Gln) amidotransferase subunit A
MPEREAGPHGGLAIDGKVHANDGLCRLDAVELAGMIRRREVSAVEVVDAHLARVEARQPEVNAYVTRLDAEARLAARAADRALAAGEKVGPLHGVPLAVKDQCDKAGVRTTHGLIGVDIVPTHSAVAVERLERAGAITLGKTNVPELGHKGTTDNLRFGPTSTPFAIGVNAGGSSGGSAAAVADGQATIGLGGDGGGSIRIPASCCGIYGMKPSWGRVPFASLPDRFADCPYVSFGPLTRTVRDAALMLQVIAGPDWSDPASLPDAGVDYRTVLDGSLVGAKIAYSPDFGGFPVEPAVAEVVGAAVLAFEREGAIVEEMQVALPASAVELGEIWRELDSVEAAIAIESFEAEGISVLDHGSAHLTASLREGLDRAGRLTALQYRRYALMRTSLYDMFEGIFARYDLLVTPTLGTPPMPNQENGATLGPSSIAGQAIDQAIGWCLTFPVNFAGHPAASLPAGMIDDRLPVGMQVIGPRYRDDAVLAASAAFERAAPWDHSYALLHNA